MEPTYSEMVRIGWAIWWRAVGSFLLLLFVINLVLLLLVPELVRAGPSVWASVVPIAVSTVVSVFLIMPFVVRALLGKSFRGGRLHVAFREEHGAPHERVPRPSGTEGRG